MKLSLVLVLMKLSLVLGLGSRRAFSFPEHVMTRIGFGKFSVNSGYGQGRGFTCYKMDKIHTDSATITHVVYENLIQLGSSTESLRQGHQG